MTTQRLLLMGAPGSPYTRKMLALLRYRRLPYEFIVRNSPRLAGLPKPKVELLPTFFLPGASGVIEAVTDSTPLIRRFEAQFAERPVRPPDPVIAFLDSLLEDYADEWLTKAMFHYRWHFEADIRKAGDLLPRFRNLTASAAEAAAASAAFSARQISRLQYVGSNPVTAPVIEASYLRCLDALEAHFAVHPFLMGARPGASDFGVFGQLTQLVRFDPTPSAIALERAPRVCTWVDLMEDGSGLEPAEAGWIRRDALPATLLDLLKEVGRVHVPVLLANARALEAGAAQVETTIDGRPWTQNPFPYQGKCLRWLREEFAALGEADRALALAVLDSTGCRDLVGATP